MGVSVPKPFFLPKALEECSSRDLEHALRRWRASWLPAAPLQQFTHSAPRDSFHGHTFLTQTLAILPGGRWVLGACDDGSVWYFDLTDDWTSTSSIEPKPLIPGYIPDSWNKEEKSGLDVWLAFDWTSPEALGSSAETHHLTQFNLALFIRPWRQEHAHIDVWQVRIQEGANMLGVHLSSFRERARSELTYISLYGGSLAYILHILVIVDWREANGRAKDRPLSCRCLFRDADFVEVCPLPKSKF